MKTQEQEKLKTKQRNLRGYRMLGGRQIELAVTEQEYLLVHDALATIWSRPRNGLYLKYFIRYLTGR